MTDTKKETGGTLVYLREALAVPGETLSSFGKEWRSLTAEDRKELSALARKDMDKA